MRIIPALGKLRVRQEDHKFEANLSYFGRPCLKQKKKKGGWGRVEEEKEKNPKFLVPQKHHFSLSEILALPMSSYFSNLIASLSQNGSPKRARPCCIPSFHSMAHRGHIINTDKVNSVATWF
jgi:hypothetical protein